MARLNIAMLGEQETQQVQEPVESSLEVLGSQVEDSIQQAQQSQVEVDQMGGAVEDAQQATEDLMQEGQAVEDAAELPEQQQQAALESIQRNVKSILKTVGLHQAPGFAMESRSKNTKLALEGVGQDIKEFVKKIWDKIKEVWNRVVDAIKAFLKNIFDAGVRLKKRAMKVKEAAKAAEGKTAAADTKFEAPSSVKNYLRMDHKAIPAATLDKGLKGQNKLAQDIINSLTDEKAISRYGSAMDEFVKASITATSGKGDIVENEKAINAAVTRVLLPVTVHFSQEKGDLYGTDAFISDRVITLNKKTGAVDVSEIDGFKEIEEAYEVLQPFQVKTVCDIVIEQMGNYDKIDKALSTLKTMSSEIADTQAKLTKEASADDKFLVAKTKSYTASMITNAVMNIVKNVSTKVRMIDLQINKAAIDWCAASLKEYK
jgi:predicted small secreted protein